ncbi:acyl-CoA thioesterase [Ulvibacter litoralis]|uniref:Acyl-CoA thioester hydrolase n=1 Tax=Ulvibacter litoralis TaxID=227084 RepID=A0A1G7I094_9FLAO|nr:hypothetical protein GCM10008083_30180 [Ulvibacter litoralis]SDF06160.1 acyl-CoA thioester hydrolase [Ulvibacter litoralis]
MSDLPSILESTIKVRFQDCDPFNHLNNAAYINYLINAREDQVVEKYGLDIYKMAKTEGKSWVVASNQIAYIKPAFLMENVVVQSQLVHFTESELRVEFRMLTEDKSEVKAVMWSDLVYFNFMNKKRDTHSDYFTDLFKSVVKPVEQTIFEERIGSFRKRN